jgi:uncharacterized protein HemX
VARHKAAEKEKELQEKQRILDKQKNQKRFIVLMGAALVMMIGLAIWAFTQKQVASANEKKISLALEENKKQQALAKAKELKSFGDSYMDLGKDSFACASYRAGLDSLRNYQKEELYTELKNKVDSCR